MPKTINSEDIFPKRIGIYRDNYIVIQYLNFKEDKFKKHLISFDKNANVNQTVDIIMKDPKHFPFLKKIQSTYLKNVISGENFNSYKDQQMQLNRKDFQNIPLVKQKDVKQSDDLKDYEKEKRQKELQQIQRQQSKYQMDEFQISKSFDKFQDPQLEQKVEQKKNQIKEIIPEVQQKQKEKVSQKKKKKKEKIQLEQDFEFIDDESQKKKKKKKKDKEKPSEKSKDKKQKKDKKQTDKEVIIEKDIQECFQFI